jgi:hypothetical protein
VLGSYIVDLLCSGPGPLPPEEHCSAGDKPFDLAEFVAQAEAHCKRQR